MAWVTCIADGDEYRIIAQDGQPIATILAVQHNGNWRLSFANLGSSRIQKTKQQKEANNGKRHIS